MKAGLILAIAFLAFGVAAKTPAADIPDPRSRVYVAPVRVVWNSGRSADGLAAVVRSDALVTPKHGQVPEGGWVQGSVGVPPCALDNAGAPAGVLLDFGRELHGGVQILTGRGTGRHLRMRVRFGESVAEAMSSVGEKGATNDHAIRDDVIAVPWFGSREVGSTGFRFVRIDLVTQGRLVLEAVRAVALERPMTRVGRFRCSDERLNRIYETAGRTVHLCCQDDLWDGIKRDRLVWMGDTHPETMGVLCAFGAQRILPDSLDFMAATTPPDAWMNGMPTYTLWWIRNLAEWYRFTGDTAYLRKHHQYLKDTFRHVVSGMQGGQWMAGNFLDWPTRGNNEAATAGTQGLALITARETEFLAEEIGAEELAVSARKMASELARLRPDPHGAKPAAALLGLSGLADPKAMYEQVLSRNGEDGVSTFYGYYMLEAMSAAGQDQRALDTVRDYWGAMLDMGATSFWEDFSVAWTNGAFRIDELPVAGKKDIHGDFGAYCYKGFRHSLCHGWSCGPAPWLMAHVLGVRPIGVGCRTVEVKPFLGDLEWAEGDYPTPFGVVHVRAEKRAAGTMDVRITAPDGVRVQRVK